MLKDQCLAYRVLDGYRTQGGYRVQNSRVRVQGIQLKDHGPGYRVQEPGLRAKSSGPS